MSEAAVAEIAGNGFGALAERRPPCSLLLAGFCRVARAFSQTYPASNILTLDFPWQTDSYRGMENLSDLLQFVVLLEPGHINVLRLTYIARRSTLPFATTACRPRPFLSSSTRSTPRAHISIYPSCHTLEPIFTVCQTFLTSARACALYKMQSPPSHTFIDLSRPSRPNSHLDVCMIDQLAHRVVRLLHTYTTGHWCVGGRPHMITIHCTLYPMVNRDH